MTALAQERLTDTLGLLPSRGTYPIAGNVVIYKGAMVGLNASGQALPATTIANGCVKVVGKSSATYDNTGGAAGALNVEVEYGVFGYANSAGADAISAAHVGGNTLAYAVDDQTLALTSASGTRPLAGVISEFKPTRYGGTAIPYVWIHPAVASLHDHPAVASPHDVGSIPLSLHQFREVDANGDVAASAGNGGVLASDTTPILRGNAAETTEISWTAGNSDPISTQITLPKDFDGSGDVTIDFFLYSGTTDAANLVVETGWDGGALVSDTLVDTASATAHTTTATIAAADIPNTATCLTLIITPPTHATDAIGLLGVRINYKCKAL